MTVATAYRLVVELPKSKSETIRVPRDTWQKPAIVRIWSVGQDGEPGPGKQGLAARIDLAADLARTIGEAVR